MYTSAFVPSCIMFPLLGSAATSEGRDPIAGHSNIVGSPPKPKANILPKTLVNSEPNTVTVASPENLRNQVRHDP